MCSRDVLCSREVTPPTDLTPGMQTRSVYPLLRQLLKIDVLAIKKINSSHKRLLHMKEISFYSEVLIEILNIIDIYDLQSRISKNEIHVGMLITIGDITSNYESIRLQQHQLDWLIYDLTWGQTS
jgi:hypothetical protein